MPIYQIRWSAKQLRDIANAIEGKKRDVISKFSFGDLLQISPLLPPPEGLLDFIVMRIDPKKHLLKYVFLFPLFVLHNSLFSFFFATSIDFYGFVYRRINDQKKIRFTRDMIKKIFIVPSGSRPLQFGKRGKADFLDVY
jgi:hypothetical protein